MIENLNPDNLFILENQTLIIFSKFLTFRESYYEQNLTNYYIITSKLISPLDLLIVLLFLKNSTIFPFALLSSSIFIAYFSRSFFKQYALDSFIFIYSKNLPLLYPRSSRKITPFLVYCHWKIFQIFNFLRINVSIKIMDRYTFQDCA